MSQYCYTCMNEIPEGGFCPYCQKANTEDGVVYHLRPGTVLNNRYIVGDCLGEGGFGITYIGRDLMLDIRVAIKEYYPNGYVSRNNTVNQLVTATTESQKNIFSKGKASFLDEARKVAKFLGEPGIVGVRDYFELNGTAYIIMEYLEGMNLAAYIKRCGTFRAEDIFRLMLPVTRSLKRVHDSGMIHRDISPDNIMYMSNGSLKLMDFGSARYFTNEKKEMSVLLKQGYAPEEQYRKNGEQGPWTDVYGLCATIYRCITGSIPEDALDRLRNDGLVPPSRMGFDIPEALENILIYGLAVFKENRCQNMEELSVLIERALADPEQAARETAGLRPDRRFSGAREDNYTVLADNDAPMAPQSAVRNTGTARPITGNPSAARAMNAYPAAAHPMAGMPQAVPVASYAPAGGVMAPAPAKKKNKGLLFVLIGAGVAVIAIVLVLIIAFSSSGIDGTYRMTEMVVDGEDLSSQLTGLNIEMVIKDNSGTMAVGTTQMTMHFNTDANTVTMTSGTETAVSTFRVDGTKLTIEDVGGTNRMTFVKQ